MKCCLISPYLPEKCGIAIYSSKLAKRLADHLNVTVVGNRNRSHGVDSFDNIKVVRSWKRNSATYIFDIVRCVTHHSPHVIHIQHEYLAYGARKYSLLFPMLLLFLRLLGRPIVLTMHSVVKRDRLDSDFFLNHQTGRRGARIKRSAMIIFTRAITGLVHKVIVHNQEMKNVLVCDYAVRREKTVVIAHGIDTYSIEKSIGESKELLGVSRRRIILFFGFIIPGKGLEVLIKSFSRIFAEVPDAILLIAGGYHPRLALEFPQYIGTVEKLIDQSSPGNIIFENRFVSEEELRLYVSAADLVVFPYVDDSILGASGALASCAGMGKAVVATNLPRFSSDIRNGYDGILVRPNDEDELASAIIELLEDEKLRARIGQNLKREAFKRDWTKIASMTYELYLKTIAGSSRSSSL